MCFKGRCCVGQTHWNLVGPVLLVALGLLGSGCATTHTRTGQSGRIDCEAICCSFFGWGGWSFTVVLREPGGVGVSFRTMNLSVPGGSPEERPFLYILGPHEEIRQKVSIAVMSGLTPPWAEVEFR